MVKNIRKKAHSGEYKFRVALEAIRGEKTVADLCMEYGVVSSQVFKWKKALLEKGKEVFEGKRLAGNTSCDNREIEKLHATIGRLTVENDFLAKFAGRSR